MFFLGLAIAFGLVALGGTWKPALGLDLQGGTRITLTAQGRTPAAEQPQRGRARSSTSASTAPVSPRPRSTTQGNKYIVVEIPGDSRARPRRHGQAPGPAAVPAGGLHGSEPAATAVGTTATAQGPPRPTRQPGVGVAAGRVHAPASATAPSRRRPPAEGPPAVRRAPTGQGQAAGTRRADRGTVGRRLAEPSAGARAASAVRRRTVTRAPSGGAASTDAADVDGQPRPGVRSTRSTRSPARRTARRRRRRRPGQAAGHLCDRDDGSKYLLSAAHDRGHRARRRPPRRHPAEPGQLGRQPRLRRRRHRRPSPRSPRRSYGTAATQFAIVLDGQVHLRADDERR